VKISLKEIISLVVEEVILELGRKGIQVDSEVNHISKVGSTHKIIKMELKEYKTPLLTENHILEIDPQIVEIEVPIKTIITPSAQDLIRKRKIIITNK